MPEPYCRLWKERIQEVFETRHQLEVENYFPTVDGLRFYQSRCVPEYGADGTVANVLVVSHDLTEIKRHEEALSRSEKQYRELFENMTDGFAYCKMVFENSKPQDFIYLSVNNAFETLTGLKNVAGKRVTEVIPGIREADPELFEIYGRVSLTGKPERFEMFVEALKEWFSVSVYSPEKKFFVAAFDVITERKRAEVALRESLERLDLALISSRMANFDWDIVTNKRTWSDGVHRLLGTKPEFFTGAAEEFFQIIHPEDRGTVQAALAKALGTGEYETEYRAVWPDGGIHHLAARGKVHHDNTGQAVFMTGVCWDISERKRAEEEINRLNVDLLIRNDKLV